MKSFDIPVVGLGASAGGLEAFRRFFEAAPADAGMAYVLIQHLDPTHPSMMVDLLAGHTAMTVRQAVDDMAIETDHIYVIAPGSYLAIENGVLRVSARWEHHDVRLPFDYLLRSLAKACGEKAVAVILSGTGADGSLGLRAIVEQGGLVIAQDPEEAAFDGMPRSAIATGGVTRVLPVAMIPEAIRLWREQDTSTADPPSGSTADPPSGSTADPPSGRSGNSPDAQPGQLAAIIELLRRRTPHDFTLYKEGTLVRRIERRKVAVGAIDWAAYLDTLRNNDSEIDLLARDLLINVTHFFRDPDAFESFAKGVVSDLAYRQPLDRPLRIWVPGCSSGEEAYSLAMLFVEAITAAKRPVKLQIFASDVDREAVVAARAGLYPASIEAEVSSERLARFFIRDPLGYRVTPELRDHVVFTVHDVLSDPPFSRLDVVSCRNLLIYLRPDAQKRVLRLFHFALREDGVLFLGGSETVGDLGDRFEPIDKQQRIYRHIGRIRPGDIDFPVGTGDGARAVWSRPPLRSDPQNADLGALMRGLLLETYAPASVLINRKHETLYTLGQTDRFLQVAPGEPSRDLFALVRENLRTKLRSALHRTEQDRKCIAYTEAAPVPGDRSTGDPAKVTIDVRPLRSDGEDLLIVSFIDEPRSESRPPSPAGEEGNPARVAELERELEATGAELQNAIRNLEVANEEQKAINEEAMSVNEEFQSANEELETSKEELQSLNEELNALNNQLQETVERERSTTNDLQNILNSSDVATLFLDDQLNIRLFTPAAKSLFGVIATDIGRPMSDLARRFDDPGLPADAQAVLTTLTPSKREVRTDTGVWCIRRILPYRTRDGRTEGVVITFSDISEIKAVEQKLETARAYAVSVNDTVHHPLLVLDGDLRVVSANRAFYRFFGKTPGDSIGERFTAGADASGDLHRLNGFLELMQADPGSIDDHEIEIDLPQLGRRYLMVNARNVLRDRPEERLILLAIDDVTERKRATAALEAAKWQAENANLAKSRFLAAASHDLRQPLQTLTLLQGLLARKVTDRAASELVSRIDETLGVMTGMLNTLLDINQIEAGVVRAEITCFPVDGILSRLKSEFDYHAKAHRLGWRVIGNRSVVRSDPRLLEQIIRNLLSNAIKYTTRGGVLLGCRRRGDTLRIEIWDTGCGIPEAQYHMIFDEFTQLDNAARERSKGLGLGLAIVKRLADMLGHRVHVRSVLGKGSVFGIEVPIVDAAEGYACPLSHDRPADPPVAPAGKTILIIEDDPEVREALELLLEFEGYRPRVVGDGAAALELVARGDFRPDLIVADYNLPGGLTGDRVIERMRQAPDRPPCPAIILTGDISLGTLENISRQGCPHLGKPVRATELMRLIHELLSQPSEPAESEPIEAGPVPPVTIFVVDDDHVMRETMRALLESNHRTVETYSSAEAFLHAWHPDRAGCLLVDAHMGGISGIELVERLAAGGHTLPAIIITGFGDVPMAVRAMKAGATDFIEKPVRADELLSSIDRAIALYCDHTKREASRKVAADLLAALTERQRQIMDLVLAGCPSKNIAADLGISQRTVENHRAAIMRKTGSKSLPALARLALGSVQ
ncbi:MAG: chemotaxis protein CheB [Rhodospirillaceae bacterium]